MAVTPEDLVAAERPPVDTKGMTEEQIALLRGDVPITEGEGAADEQAGEVPSGDGAAPAGKGDEAVSEPRVPQSRVNEIVARSRNRLELAQKRISELEAAVVKGEEELNFGEVEAKIDELEVQYSNLILEGKAPEAAQMRRDIRAIERRLMQTQSAYHAETRSTQAIEQLKTDGVIDELEAGYAFLDPHDPSYDEETVNEILAYQRGFVAAGHRGDVAMAMAANFILSQLDLVPEGGEEAEEIPGEPAAGGGLRHGTDLQAKAALAARLPPGMRAGRPGAPMSVGAKDLAALGQQGFDKLRPKMSEDDLARARGDKI